MSTGKLKRLQAAGWKVGTAKDFLGLSREEAALVELRLSLISAVKLSLAKGRIIVEPLPEAGLSLKKLVSQITVDNLHRETDAGQAKGLEVW
ncbi:MAG: hypothetical protein ACRET9_06350 [Burkholderiales bacterium]